MATHDKVYGHYRIGSERSVNKLNQNYNKTETTTNLGDWGRVGEEIGFPELPHDVILNIEFSMKMYETRKEARNYDTYKDKSRQ